MPIIIQLDIEEIQNGKIQTQLNFLAQAVQDLFKCIKENKDELFVQSLFSSDWQSPNVVHNAQSICDRTETVLNKVSGVVSGHHKEFQLAFKQSRKTKLDGSELRTIYFDTRGDVAVDYGNGFGKAIQCKSSFADGNSNINEMIKVAANQLTGERVASETPSAKDRRIIDISIKSPNNPWPRSNFGTTFFTTTEVESTIHSLVSQYVTHNLEVPDPTPRNPNKTKKLTGVGYNKWNELNPTVTTHLGKGSKGNISRITGFMPGGQLAIGVDFVTKIRYDTPRKFTVNGREAHVRQITTRTYIDPITKNVTTTHVLIKGDYA